MLGGDIILQVDHIVITGEDSFYELWEHVSSTHATVTHTIKVLRDGEIREFRWILSEFQPNQQ
jgi:hypothetical protein